MKNIYIILTISCLFFAGCKDDFLDREPLDQFSDDIYWKTEKEVSTFAWGFYTAYFTGYGSGFTWGKYFSGETLNDDFAPTTPTAFTKNVPTSGGGWGFTWVRKSNLFISRIDQVPMTDEAKRHWKGVARFFRALEYNDLVKSFGDVPWYNEPLSEDSPDLYKERDPQVLVIDSILADFKYAAENVRASDNALGPKAQIVNKYTVLAFMSRIFLYHGTRMKYWNINQTKATEYLEAAKWAANEVMTKGGYSLGTGYRTLFNSLDLTGNPEIIMFRQYATAQSTHSLHSYVNKEAQTGTSKNAVESYLCKDGLPISLSPLYKGDRGIANVMADRDPRIKETFASELRLPGIASNYSTSGYAVIKFFNETIKDVAEGNSNTNTTDAPIIRYGEVLVNYAEACAELGTLTQSDLDRSINLLRNRNGIGMPRLQVVGDKPAVNDVVYDDPKRDPLVPSLIWEIRRERRVELMMEGFRNDDLKRWRKYEYLDTKVKTDINRGAWIKKSDYPKATVTLEGTTEGYIIPAPKPETQRVFESDKVYLSPLPLDQIKLYKDQGVDLRQNPGWENQ
ncbi:RagB/SusD family nutrient uptake outer membrane protein [Arcticibacter tournemirensis]|uniref:RagB/SusD family nutrient uptake outer membrane protein n=1 Tax=Arcticibacter tournemirensis TaxID=699437 RepID=A0A4Q0M7V1_9SPHI|nr:RagB/SusD family nutrient uptake outer membrane protein [Arcticibacter tournemirensis]RXF68806.1 RagB/SusD family nutrient uptake outer membrane protein [Arcticibacter tournemirensis]